MSWIKGITYIHVHGDISVSQLSEVDGLLGNSFKFVCVVMTELSGLAAVLIQSNEDFIPSRQTVEILSDFLRERRLPRYMDNVYSQSYKKS